MSAKKFAYPTDSLILLELATTNQIINCFNAHKKSQSKLAFYIQSDLTF